MVSIATTIHLTYVIPLVLLISTSTVISSSAKTLRFDVAKIIPDTVESILRGPVVIKE
jgi:hypothetical protein